MPGVEMSMRILIVTLLVLLAGCAGPEIRQYAAEQPRLQVPAYLDGEIEAWGMFQDRSGDVVKRFHVAMTASWEGEVGTLDERFTYSDGTTQTRVWTLRPQADGTWRGTAADVIGEALGEVSGNTLHWRYKLLLDVGDDQYVVDMDDWMFLMDDRVLLNRTRMSKWGVHLGDLTISFYKPK